ncbi:hypothetical protein O1M63_55090 [Streptomyces mirabilis]|nr:hypothetical protein [Streptomyces mirabilis]
MQLCTRSAVNSAERGRAFAYRELAKAAIVGVLGLAAVGLSLWFAVRGAGASRAAWRPSGTPPTSSPPASCPT